MTARNHPQPKYFPPVGGFRFGLFSVAPDPALNYVVSGRVVLELDDGATCELSAGDTVVQNGTRHAWRNPYDEPCLLVAVSVGANHSRL